jgi:RNA polymerase sigma factor (sigma-70 family)
VANLFEFDRDALIEHFLPLLHKLAAQLRPQLSPAFETDDLIQEGVIALIAVFEGLPFYIRQRCGGAMLNYLKTEWRHEQHVELQPEIYAHSPSRPRLELARAVETLPTRERNVIEMRLEGHTLREIGPRLGVSHVRAHQIERKGIHLLRKTA